MDLLVQLVRLDAYHFLAFGHLTPFEVPRGDYGFAANEVFAADDRKFKIVSFVHFGVLGPLANGGGGEPLFVPRLRKRGEAKKWKVVTSKRWRESFSRTAFPSDQ